MSDCGRMVLARLSLCFTVAIMVMACGGRAQPSDGDDGERGSDEPMDQPGGPGSGSTGSGSTGSGSSGSSSSGSGNSGSGNSGSGNSGSGSSGSGSGGYSVDRLPPCRLGPLLADTDFGSCNWTVEDRCYEERIAACACACPRDRDNRCVSGSPGNQVPVTCF